MRARLPVPDSRRVLATPDEIHNLDGVARVNRGRLVLPALDDRLVQLDRDAARVDLQVGQQVRDRERRRDGRRLAVEDDVHLV